MKRGIIMEIKKRKAIILTKEGSFEAIRIKRGTYPEIGDEINVDRSKSEVKKSPLWLPAVAAIAAVFIFIIFMGGFQQNDTIAAYVSYDVNPSFSVAMNDELEVVSVKSWNKDAEGLFSNWDNYQHMSLKAFTDKVVRKFEQSGYLEGHPHLLIASSVVAEETSKKANLQSHLQQTIRQVKTTLSERDSLVVTVKNAAPQTRMKASRNGMSLGKYMLYLDVKNQDRSVAINTAKSLSVSDLTMKLENRSQPVVTIEQPIVDSEDGIEESKTDSEEQSQNQSGVAKKLDESGGSEQNKSKGTSLARNKNSGKSANTKPDHKPKKNKSGVMKNKNDDKKNDHQKKKDKKKKKGKKKNKKNPGKEKKEQKRRHREMRDNLEDIVNGVIDQIFKDNGELNIDAIRENRGRD